MKQAEAPKGTGWLDWMDEPCHMPSFYTGVFATIALEICAIVLIISLLSRGSR